MRKLILFFLGMLIFLSFIFVFINHIIYSNKMSVYEDDSRKNYRENTSFYVSGDIFKMEKIGSFAYALFVKVDSVNISKTISESDRVSGVYDANNKIAILLSVSKSYDTEIKKKELTEPLYVKAVCDKEVYKFYFSHNKLNLTTELSDTDITNKIAKYLLQQMDTMRNPIKF